MMNKTSENFGKSGSYDDTFVDDSFDKLEQDLDRAVHYEDEENEEEFGSMACAYMNRSGDMCGDCKFFSKYGRNCTNQMLEDIASRIRNLNGEN